MQIARDLTRAELLEKQLQVLRFMTACAERSSSPEDVWADSYSEWANDLKRIERQLSKS